MAESEDEESDDEGLMQNPASAASAASTTPATASTPPSEKTAAAMPPPPTAPAPEKDKGPAPAPAPAPASDQPGGANSDDSDDEGGGVTSSMGQRKPVTVPSVTEEEETARRFGEEEMLAGNSPLKGNEDDAQGDASGGAAAATCAYVDKEGLSQLQLRTNCASAKKSVFEIPHHTIVHGKFRDSFGEIMTPIELTASVFFCLAGQRTNNTRELIQTHTLHEIWERLLWVASANKEGAQKISHYLPCKIVDWDETNTALFKEHYDDKTGCFQVCSKNVIAQARRASSQVQIPKDLVEVKGVREYVSLTPKDEAKVDVAWKVVNAKKDEGGGKGGGRRAKSKGTVVNGLVAQGLTEAGTPQPEPSVASAAGTGIPLPPTAAPAAAATSRPTENGVFTEFSHIPLMNNGPTPGAKELDKLEATATAAIVTVETAQEGGAPAPAPAASTSITEASGGATSGFHPPNGGICVPKGEKKRNTIDREWWCTSNEEYDTGYPWPEGAKRAKINYSVSFHWD